MTRRVLVLHPWLPQYREAFFLGAVSSLAAQDVELTVAHGAPPPEWRSRSDAIERTWAHRVPTRYLTVAGTTLAHRRTSMDGYDLVVLEQAIRNLENYRALIRPRGTRRVALWGHGRTLNKTPTPLEKRLKAWMTRRASWFFAYTQGGADYVTGLGFPASRVTVVRNTIDTRDLESRRKAVTHEEAADLRDRLGLDPGPTALFMGGLDGAKRLDFLVAAGREIARAVPGFNLVIAGDGSDREFVTTAVSRYSWLRYIGRVPHEDKAALAAVCQLMLMPAGVGLVAVDSFALRLPIVTTTWPYHGPEVEYLRSGENALICAGDLTSYVSAVVSTLQSPGSLEVLVEGCRKSVPLVTLQGMVDRFSEGVLKALATP